jgi:DNA-binding transcriptional LysR family regulator
MTTLNRILTFAKVAEHQSFVGAGRALGISKVAVSKQISQLEQELGVTLFLRTTRNVSLTEAGIQLLGAAEPFLAELNDLEGILHGLGKEPSGRLRILSNPYFAKTIIIPHLNAFHDQFPKVTVEIDFSERIADFEKENIDLMIGMSISGPENSVQRKIMTTRYVLCAAPSYLKKHDQPLKPADLKQHAYITHTMRKPNDALIFKSKLEIHLQPILYLNDVDAMVQCALEGMGIIAVHDYAVNSFLQSGALVEVLKGALKSEVPIWVCYPERRYIAPKVRQFIDFILEKMAK